MSGVSYTLLTGGANRICSACNKCTVVGGTFVHFVFAFYVIQTLFILFLPKRNRKSEAGKGWIGGKLKNTPYHVFVAAFLNWAAASPIKGEAMGAEAAATFHTLAGRQRLVPPPPVSTHPIPPPPTKERGPCFRV
jgi:hypothetical protein